MARAPRVEGGQQTAQGRGQQTVRGASSEQRGGACSEHEHEGRAANGAGVWAANSASERCGGRKANGAGACAASTSAGGRQRTARESGQGRCINEVENQGSLSQ